jgi:D-xylose transport system permease protein
MSTESTETPAPVQTADNIPAVDAAEPQQTLAGAAREWWIGVRNGELGALPIIVGIVVIAVYFQARNSQFLTAGNFVNLIAQMAAVTIIGMGIVFVLLLGEIDLSVGFLSGMGGVIAAVLLRPDGNQWSTAPALIAAIGTCTVIGLFQGFWFARIGVPSFVVTLAGLLAWNGVVLQVIGSKGTIVIQDKVINGLANDYMSNALAWGVLIVSIAAYTAQQVLTVFRRRQSGLPNRPWSLIGLQIALLAAAGIFVVEWADTDRGIPYVGLLMLVLYVFWTFISQRTRFGRYVYAVGGNAEAARRAGINVARIRIVVFGISGMMAAIGGIVLASRLSSVDTSTGGGSILLYSIAAAVIGGTSLFGGRGSVKSAVLGGIVIGMVANGLGLLNVSVGTQYVVTGTVLLAAATLDSLSRRRSAATGRA